MTTVKGGYPDHIVSLLGLVMDAVRRELSQVMTGPDAPRALRGLRASHLRLLSLTPRGCALPTSPNESA